MKRLRVSLCRCVAIATELHRLSGRGLTCAFVPPRRQDRGQVMPAARETRPLIPSKDADGP